MGGGRKGSRQNRGANEGEKKKDFNYQRGYHSSTIRKRKGEKLPLSTGEIVFGCKKRILETTQERLAKYRGIDRYA